MGERSRERRSRPDGVRRVALAFGALLGAFGAACPNCNGVVCGSDRDCPPGLSCVSNSSGTLCGVPCSEDAACPREAFCNLNRQVCEYYGSCPTQECPDGSVCSAAARCERNEPAADGGAPTDGGGADGGFADGGCPVDFDVSGTFTQRTNCEEAAPDGGICVDHDQTSTLIVARRGSSLNDYSIQSPQAGGFTGGGWLCGSSLKWGGGQSGANSRFGSGTWEFSDAHNFTQSMSSYGGQYGPIHCTATGSSSGPPPPPAPLGACH